MGRVKVKCGKSEKTSVNRKTPGSCTRKTCCWRQNQVTHGLVPVGKTHTQEEKEGVRLAAG